MEMATEAKRETHGFQTEVKQLLQLMIHSLYSDKEIFLRELVSNATDAADKLRFEALTNSDLLATDSELKIEVEFDKDAKTLTIRDNGIGMSRDEIIENLGTIAKSGTKHFLEKLTGDQSKDSQMIGQFGVGFYASFMVADKITVSSLRAGFASEDAVRWESDGAGEYTVENIEKSGRGTSITLHMKDDAIEFLDDWRLRSIISKYSDHISLPIQMKKMATPGEDEKEADTAKDEWETVNKAKAIWTRAKSDIKAEEYKEFYKTLSHDYQDPMLWSHNKVEGNQQFTTLLYVPSKAPFDLYDRDQKSGLKLYIQRVFIMDNAEFMPSYLRFVKGVIDSADLPLNVSREILQNNRLVETIKASAIKKVLSSLSKTADKKPEEYAKFWAEFGKVLKEGVVEDRDNSEKLQSLMRFASTHNNSADQTVSLADYVARMKEGQKHIYYLTAENYAAAVGSPHLEYFKKKGVEVLLLVDRVDEWMLSALTEFDGKQLKSVSKGELDGLEDTEEEKKVQEAKQKDFEAVIKQVKEALGDKVSEVRVTTRLTDSPACIVADNDAMSMHLQRMMAQAGQAMPSQAPIFELNPEHALVLKLKDEQDDALFSEWSHLLLEQALLTEGGQLEDPVAFVKRMNKLLA